MAELNMNNESGKEGSSALTDSSSIAKEKLWSETLVLILSEYLLLKLYTGPLIILCLHRY